jgi:DNA adenine methylase
MSYISSPLKWAGGKGKALKHILPILEQHKKKVFVEPFMGALNVSLNFQDCDMYILNDLNWDLYNTFGMIKYNPEQYIEVSNKLFDQGLDYYEEARDIFNSGHLSPVNNAAYFQYVNKFGFNGLCRYNKSGKFNVPRGSGGKKNVPIASIMFTNDFLNNKEVTLYNNEFETLFDNISEMEDVLIYCDPPYVSLNSNFKYTQDGFGLDKQEKLKQLAKESKHTVIISNHLTSYTEALYSDADEIYTFPVQRTISCDGGGRKQVMEIVAVYK